MLEAGSFGLFLTGNDVTDYVDAHAAIEIEVAKGLGLTSEMLRRIYDSSQSQRRGFWRFFDSEPRAVTVVERVLRHGSIEDQPNEQPGRVQSVRSVA